jgi:hypothetical protein
MLLKNKHFKKQLQPYYQTTREILLHQQPMILLELQLQFGQKYNLMFLLIFILIFTSMIQ